MYICQVPEGLEMNKDNIYMASESPRNVINAYYDQFQTDFSTFLKCRSEEVVSGGKMVLTILGRKTEEVSTKECCYVWELLALSLKEMVSQVYIFTYTTTTILINNNQFDYIGSLNWTL